MAVATHHSSDWFARVLGIAGLVLGLASFGWQVFTYQNSLAERVVVTNVSRWHVLKEGLSVDDLVRRGDLSVEIVNVGQQPIYIRSVRLKIGPETWTFPLERGHDAPLAAGDVTSYRLRDWDFDAHPLDAGDDESAREDYTVIVASNKGEILRYTGPISYQIYSSVRPSKATRTK